MILLDETKLERRSLAPAPWSLRLLLKWRHGFGLLVPRFHQEPTSTIRTFTACHF